MVGLLNQFGQKIAGWLGHGGSATPAGPRALEKRQCPRLTVCAATTCEPAVGPAGEKLTATVRDISQGGIRLSVSRRCEPGSLLHVAMPNPNPSESSALLACVVHVQNQVEGNWALGCSFIRELSNKEMRAFLS
jgi:hypothetical protein